MASKVPTARNGGHQRNSDYGRLLALTARDEPFEGTMPVQST